MAQARSLVELLLADPADVRDEAGSLDRGAADRVVGLVQGEVLLGVAGGGCSTTIASIVG